MLTTENIDDMLQRNGNVLSADGDKIGSVGQVYADDADGQPTWVTVKTGLFGSSESFVPLQDARLEGSDILVSVHQGPGQGRAQGGYGRPP